MVSEDPLRRRVGEASDVRAVFDRIPLMVVGLRGPEHRYVAANAAYREYLDTAPDLLGRPVREVLPEVEGQRVLAMLDRVYDTGVSESGREWQVQTRQGAPSGEEGRYLDFTVTPHREDGAVVGLVVHVQDVTELMRTGQRSSESAVLHDPGRESLVALQEALLPDGLPVLPRVDIAGRYLVAEAPGSGGGDWFDAVALGSGRVALVVGDVVGHGMPASAVMGQLRAVISDQFACGADLPTAVRRAQRYAERTPTARAATMCVAVLDPETGVLGYVTCGSPAPLVVSPEGRTRFLDPTGGRPLGSVDRVTVGEAVMAEGEVVVLYTDGLLERSGVPMAVGRSELAAVAADTAADRAFLRRAQTSLAQRVCAQTVELVARHARLEDDVTVLVAQRRPVPVEDFEQDMPARPGLLALLRQRLADWLTTLGAGSEDLFSAQIAVVEAVTNAVEHAYEDRTGAIEVRGRLDGDGTVEVTVRDFGRWRPVEPRPGLRGRGLALIQQCMHTMRADTGPGGTTVWMSRSLRAEVFLDPLGTGRPAIDPDPGRQVEYGSSVGAALSGEPVRVTVVGPVDMSTVPRLRATLSEAGRGGVLPLEVDLRSVTHLGSSGIQLFSALDAECPGRVRLLADPGGIARHVLDMTGLSHLTTSGD